MKTGHLKMTKRDWYASGGFANPSLYRRQSASGGWAYYQVVYTASTTRTKKKEPTIGQLRGKK